MTKTDTITIAEFHRLTDVIAVGSPHRDEGFKACRYIIEQIKHRSPVWKLEHYVDGDSEWSKGCELCSHANIVDAHNIEHEHNYG